MNSNTDYSLIPVRRCRRHHWQAPLEAYARAQDREADAKLAEQFKGTTPYGREIFRRTVDLAWRRVAQGKNTVEAVNEVRAQLEEFPDLREEFVLLLSVTWERDTEEVRQGTCQGWATLLVLEAKAAQRMNQIVSDACHEA